LEEGEDDVMAMYDWNRNGKKDMGDNFIEYNIYQDVTGNNRNSSSSVSSDWWVPFVLYLIMAICPPLGVIIFLGILIFG